MTDDAFFLTNLELRASTETGEQAEGLSHRSMEGMVLLSVLELAARGEPRGAVTFVHDIGDYGGRYKHLARVLADKGWAVALPDLRGHGISEGERGHSAGLTEVLRDLGEVQDHLAYRLPDASKILIGQGVGALYAAAFALERPGVVEALVLLAPLHAPAFQLPQAPSGLKKFFNKVTGHTPGSIGYVAEQLTSAADAARDWQQDEHTHDVVTKRAGEEIQRAAAYLGRLRDAGIPVLVLHGEADEIASADLSRALAADNVEVQTFVGGRHQLLHDASADEVTGQVTAWLEAKFA